MCMLSSRRPAAPAEWDATPVFTSTISAVSFYMNTTPMDYTTAERMCNLNGGHLATFGRWATRLTRAEDDASSCLARPRCSTDMPAVAECGQSK